MNLQKKLAARLLKVSPKKIRLDPAEMEQIKESITKIDVRGLLSNGVIVRVKTKGQSRGRARKIATQKTKGRQRGYGSRKGTKKTRTDKKRTWINKIRKQRELLQSLKSNEKIDISTYRQLYRKAKGGFFRSVRHIKLYIEEKGLLK